jgi:8-hydroxy-5-deazaflavin:NADPH oxidoreductase
MNIAVVGLGNIGGQLATALVEAGHRIAVVDHGSGKAQAFAEKSKGKAYATTLPDALAKSDMIIFGVWFNVIRELIPQYRDKLAGKVVVDPSNPIAPDAKGGFKKTIPQNESSGQILAALLPSGTKFVKAFGTLGAASLKSGAHRSPEPAVLFYASDDETAGNEVASLIRDIGFAPVRVGGIDQSIRLEVFGDLHEFGKLGRLVNAKEALSLI